MDALKSCWTRPHNTSNAHAASERFAAGNLPHRVRDLVASAKSQYEDLSTVDKAHALGWASIAIGLTELAAPGLIQHCLGIEDRPAHRGILRALGVRELMHGIGILTEDRINDRLSAGVWSRVAGDALDTALLGIAATKTRKPAAFALTAAAVGAIGVADFLCAMRMPRH